MDQLRSLRVFAEVVSRGSFAAAARALDLAPSVATRAVADLESHLGARLLNRSSRRLELTEIGQACLEKAQTALAEIDDMAAVAGVAVRDPAGTLRVKCPPAFSVHQLAPLLPGFRARYPHVQFEISAHQPVETADPAFDVSIVTVGQQPLEGEFIVRPLAKSAFILCATPGWLALNGKPLAPEQLLGHDAILPQVAAVRRALTLHRRDERIELPINARAIVTSHLDTIFAAALAGLGIAGLPSFVASAALRDGRLERILPDWTGGDLRIYAAMPSRKHLPARTRAWVGYLVERVGGDIDRDPWMQAT